MAGATPPSQKAHVLRKTIVRRFVREPHRPTEASCGAREEQACAQATRSRETRPRKTHVLPHLQIMKAKGMNEAQFLALLQKVLPKATQDPLLASRIYDEVAKEVQLSKHLASFEKFCEKGAL